MACRDIDHPAAILPQHSRIPANDPPAPPLLFGAREVAPTTAFSEEGDEKEGEDCRCNEAVAAAVSFQGSEVVQEALNEGGGAEG